MNNIQKHFHHIINYDLINKLNLKNIFKIPTIDKIILNIGLKNSNMEKKKMILIRNLDEELIEIHSQLKLNYGTLNEEYPEQKLTYAYLTGNEKVLEIGGNIGRNSVLIGHILSKHNNSNFVTLTGGQQFSQDVRTSVVFVSASLGAPNFQIFAGLTNIPVKNFLTVTGSNGYSGVG